MIRRFVVATLALSLLSPGAARAQSRQELAARRLALAARVPDGVILVLGGGEPAQDFLSFAQAASFYYLTGIREPEAALVMVRRGGLMTYSTIFVRPRQPGREVWTGARLGTEGAASFTGMRGRGIGELPSVLDSLAATGQALFVVGDLRVQTAEEEEASGAFTALTADEQFVERLKKKHPSLKVTPVNDIIERLRGTKSPSELALIRKAVDITVRAQKEAIAAMRDGFNEFEIQALIEYTFRRNGADRPSFATIVGSGPNSTTLHYNADDRFIGADDMVVMDIGASYKGYAADVTRTVPASGRFNPAQRQVYQLVRDAQAAAEKVATLGAPSRSMNEVANTVLTAGLTRLGLIDSPDATYDCNKGPSPRQCPQYRLYYMHGLGHGIGLDVHDPDQYYYTSKLSPGSVFTIEPGIYVREHVLEEMPDTPRNRELASRLRPAVTRFRNIGVRIEDDYAVTETGVEWLSKAPREIAELEALMRQGATGPAARDRNMVDSYRDSF